ncbi:uncharacterized protein N0V89_001382 [Didymosphaeria variabile]|uniref:Ankyrin n=1 Tax=Didymosphaeria variabile TaxID=1932322 RepID=A0A9W9CGP4_9PLEO|nr:uncharacterized protein N0V89_001382 [Didymosphaeria variabile]KAJ4360815.1 hypothetical protein N0V89_001382 [Didymosphaeria variabile]
MMPGNLLDLPPEMFRMVIGELVTDTGIARAWKLRGVCRTFAVEIRDEIFARQPSGIIRRSLHTNLVGKNIGFWLSNIMKTSLKADGALMYKVKELLDYIVKLLSITDEEKRRICAQKLFTGLTWNFTPWEIDRLVWTDRRPKNSTWNNDFQNKLSLLLGPITTEQKLSAAISVGSGATITAHFQPNLDTTGTVFGKPLSIATFQGDQALIHTLIGCYGGFPNILRIDLAEAISIAVQVDNIAMFHALLGYWDPVKGTRANQKRCIQNWLAHAARQNSIPMIDAILAVKKHRGPLIRIEVEAICQNCSAITAQHYLNNGSMDPDITWTNSSPLLIATKRKDLDMIKAMLEAGADMDKAAGDNTTALYVACRDYDYTTARYLLDQGADSDLLKWPDRRGTAWNFYHRRIIGHPNSAGNGFR